MNRSISTAFFLATFLSVAVLGSPSSGFTQAAGNWDGRYTIGVYLADTDCDEDAVKMLKKEELAGKLLITTKVIKKKGVRSTSYRATGLGRKWNRPKAPGKKRYVARHMGESSRFIFTETLTIRGAKRRVRDVTLKGSVAVDGEVCSYLYEGSVSR